MDNEKETKKRGWVKNAAIIFLIVLLVLTFFSNTILNWSLPEVKGQYAGWGTILTSVRGTGTVTANMGYAVRLSSEREIRDVLIRQGDYITAGQTLFLLAEEGESEELTAALEMLEEMRYNYNVRYLQLEKSDYGDQTRAIEDLKTEIAELEALRVSLAELDAELKAAGENTAALTAKAEQIGEQIAEIEEKITEEASENASGDPEVAKALTALESAQASLKAAEREQEEANRDVAEYQSCLTMSYDSAKAMYRAASDELDAAKIEYTDTKELYDSLKAAAESDLPDGEKPTAEELRDAERAFAAASKRLENATEDFNDAEDEYQNASEYQPLLNEALADQAKAERRVSECTEIVGRRQDALNAAAKTASKALIGELDAAKAELKTVNASLKEAQKKEEEIAGKMEMTLPEADAELKAKKRELDAQVAALEKQQASDEVTDKLNDLELQKARSEIAKQEAAVEKLRGTGSESEVVSKYSGIVTSVMYMAGDTVPSGEALATVDVEGKGYTMSIPVTNEQSRQINVGDAATISNNWWSNITAVVSAIRNDPSNPGKGKLVDLDIGGDVSDGQSLTVSIGERQTGYNLVVPNSAVKEDADGTFILIASAKSTPLGTRYIAERVDVTVITKDSVNTALEAGTEYGYDYVITNTSAPLSAGQQVRLASD